MEKRKNPEKDLRKQSGLFFQIGLLAAMMLAVCAFEYRAEKTTNCPVDLGNINLIEDPLIPLTVQEPPPPPKPKLVNPVEAEPDDIEPPMLERITVDPEEIPDPPLVAVEEPKEEVPEPPFTIVEKMPEPEGGLEAFYSFINKNLKYPAQARRIGVEGTVFVSFIVDKQGNMTEITIAKGIGAGCDEEVLRIFEKNPPKWTPGKQRGVPVKVKKMIPVKFVLNN